jgi:hypothetical protein
LWEINHGDSDAVTGLIREDLTVAIPVINATNTKSIVFHCNGDILRGLKGEIVWRPKVFHYCHRAVIRQHMLQKERESGGMRQRLSCEKEGEDILQNGADSGHSLADIEVILMMFKNAF